MEKDKWIDGILGATGEIKKVAAPNSILDAVQYRVRDEKVSVKRLWLAAASVAILAALNLVAIQMYKPAEPNTPQQNETGFYETHQLYK